MAIFHLHVKNISRGDGRSAVACAAYRAGETLPNEAEESESRFGGRRDVLHAEVRLPAAAPAWMTDRANLWNAVERAERRRDARLAKEIEFSLPRELPKLAWLDLARTMADAYTARGHVVDLSIHDDGKAQNPHVHLMLTTRQVDEAGFGAKLREADQQSFVRDARSRWTELANAALGKVGSDATIDHLSHAARGVPLAPGAHHGPDRAARRAKRWGREVVRSETIPGPGTAAVSIGREIGALAASLRAAQPEHQPDAIEAARPAYQELSERLNTELVERGILDPDEAQAWNDLSTVFGTEAELEASDPVPDPDGHLITQAALWAAEAAMLQEVERPYVAPEPPAPEGRSEAQDAVDRLNQAEVREHQDALRAPQNDEEWWRTGSETLIVEESLEIEREVWWERGR